MATKPKVTEEVLNTSKGTQKRKRLAPSVPNAHQ